MVTATIDASPVGKLLMPVLRLLGTTRALKRTLSHSASENFNKVTFGAETARSIEVQMSFVGQIPEFALGTLMGLVPHLGAKNARARIQSYQAPLATYFVEWD